MTAWAQLLHFYQPPTQRHDVLQRIAEESYRPLLAVLKEHRHARLAVNMNAVLTQMLVEHGLGDIVSGLAALAERGQVEFVGSGKYHPILPLIPADAQRRSINENDTTNGQLFGDSWNPRGFFPPEMCIAPDVFGPIEETAHRWVILSGVACPAAWPIDRVYRADGTTLSLLFRDDVRSNRISFRETNPERFVHDLSHVGGGNDAYVVTAMDAETFGHHIRGWERDFLAATYSLVEHQKRGRPERGTTRLRMVQPSELLAEFPDGGPVEPLPSSWSTTEDDIRAGNPFPLWRAPGNRVHAAQWEYVDHTLALVETASRFAEGKEAARYAHMADELLGPALHSCQFWWASRRPMWDVPMIHRGFELLNDAALYASRGIRLGDAPPAVKQEATWRMAAADDIRERLERHLFADEPI